GESDREEQWGDEQRRIEQPNEEDRNRQAEQRADYQADAGVHHGVELAHVVGRARHDVADLLAVVEGLALAEQIEIKLFARVALNALRDELAARDAERVEDRLRDDQTQNRQEDAKETLG